MRCPAVLGAFPLAVAVYGLGCAGLIAWLPPYELYRFTLAGAYGLAVLGLNVLLGQSGQFSIGHGAFFALGAYVCAIAGTGYGLPLPAALGLAAGGGFAAGALVGWPALKLDTVHLALVTWGLALAVPQALKSSHLAPWTGGVQGLYLERPDPPGWFPMGEDAWWFLVTAVIFLGGLLSTRNLIQSRFGRAWRALRDNPVAAAAAGVDVARSRLLAFGTSAALAALGGAITGLLTDFIAPDAYTVFFGILLLVGAVLGGIHSAWGALAGGLFVGFAPDLARDASAAVSFPLFGLLLIVAVWLFPAGLAAVLEGSGPWRRHGPDRSIMNSRR